MFKNNKFVIYFLVILGFTQFILQMSGLTRGLEYATTALAIDDTYYYLQLAWNTKHLGFVTFDGIHPTNGFQLLWFGVVVFLALLSKTKAALLFLTLAVCFLLNSLCYWPIWKLCRVLKRPLWALVVGGLWSIKSFGGHAYSNGMESSLHAFIFWCVLWQAAVFILRVQDGKRPNFFVLTGLLILNTWTRLDASVFSVTIYAFCMILLMINYGSVMLFLRANKKYIIGTLSLAAFAFLIQLLVYKRTGDTFLPVSLLVKSAVLETPLIHGPLFLEKFRYAVDLSVLAPPFLEKHIVLLIRNIAVIFVPGVLIGLYIFKRERYLKKAGRFALIWACLFLGFLLYHVIIVSVAGYQEHFVWYRTPLFIFWIITFSFAVMSVGDIIPARRIKRFYKRILPAFCIFIFIVSSFLFGERTCLTADKANKKFYTRYKAALWVSKNLPPGTVIASWEAGQLGYFCGRTVINLDGLVNSVEYYTNVIQKDFTTLAEYLKENSVDYVMDYRGTRMQLGLSEVRAFPRFQDGPNGYVRIWQVKN